MIFRHCIGSAVRRWFKD